jgi:hypothetical protein
MAILFTERPYLAGQLFGGKWGRKPELKITGAGGQSVKMKIGKTDSAILYSHRLKDPIAITKTPVIGRQDRSPGRKDLSVEIDKISGACHPIPVMVAGLLQGIIAG